jgi:putative ABC transport system permease protein
MLLVVWLVPAESLPGVLLERRLAAELAAGIGDTVWVRPQVEGSEPRGFVVSGVFERAADPNRISRNEYEARFHLPDLEAMLPGRDRVDRFAVALGPGGDADAVARWVESLAYGTQVFETARVADESSATFRVISRFHDAIGLVTLLASGIFLLCLMVIRVDERRADVRTMRLIGIGRRTVVGAIVIEAVTVASVASLVGAALGAGITVLVNGYYAAYYDTTLRFAIVTPRILVLSVALSIALGTAAGILAALRVAGVPPQRLGER